MMTIPKRITLKYIDREFKKFDEGQDKLQELTKTCKFIKQPYYTSIPMVYPDCTHPKSKYGVCGRYDECPILMIKEKRPAQSAGSVDGQQGINCADSRQAAGLPKPTSQRAQGGGGEG